MEIFRTKRIMLANLQPGQCIDYIVFESGNPIHLQAEIIHIERDCNFGCVWTIHGSLSWQMLTFKYLVVVPQHRQRQLPKPKLNRKFVQASHRHLLQAEL